jgi:hypothetical protein
VNIPSTLPVTYLSNDLAAVTGESCILFFVSGEFSVSVSFSFFFAWASRSFFARC